MIAITGIADTISPAAILGAEHPDRPHRLEPGDPGGVGRPLDGTSGTVSAIRHGGLGMNRPSVDPAFTFAVSLAVSLVLWFPTLRGDA